MAEALVAGVRLRVPDELVVKVASRETDRAVVESFVAASPERTVYHGAPYLAFARSENGAADLALFLQEGNPLLGLPVHPTDGGLTTGYSGALLPATTKESTLARSVGLLGRLAALNPLNCLQSAQAPGTADVHRSTLVERLLDEEPVDQERWYSRIVDLDDQPVVPTDGQLPAGIVSEQAMGQLDADARNQVRQAVRRGVTITVLDVGADTREHAYRAYLPVHEASWTRTGASPHSLEHLLGLSAAVTDGGGHDLVVLAHHNGRVVAGVTCHVFAGRAIYWSGASLPEALELRANPLCLKAAMAACAAVGASAFELGRLRPAEPSDKERAITRYKAQFGGYLVRVPVFASRPAAAGRLVARARRMLHR